MLRRSRDKPAQFQETHIMYPGLPRVLRLGWSAVSAMIGRTFSPDHAVFDPSSRGGT